MIAAALVEATGWKQSPALDVIVASVVALFVRVRITEPSQLDLDRAVAEERPRRA